MLEPIISSNCLFELRFFQTLWNFYFYTLLVSHGQLICNKYKDLDKILAITCFCI